MLTWGFILLVFGLLAEIILLCNNFDMFGLIGELGFGGYVAAFFDPANLTTGKVVAMISLFVFILGVVLYIIGRIKNKGAEKNPIVPEKVKKYLRDTRGEFKKITWPNFPTVVRNTLVVLAMCAVTAVVIIVVDLVCGELINLLMSL
ncbi:MAG: preprotein translocase subunit SecE [Clostridia bacterium]|nr:preprotein translocase subunit SecE [Clostridia bacterium]